MKKKLMSVVLACAVMAGLAFSTSASAYWHHGWGGGWHGGYGWHHGWGGGVRVYVGPGYYGPYYGGYYGPYYNYGYRHCGWVPGHYSYGYYVPGHRACWY